MKKNQNKTSARARAKAGSGRAGKPPRPEPGPVPELIARENLGDLQRAVRRVARRDGPSVSLLMRRLAAPLNNLEQLHRLAAAVLRQEPAAAPALRAAVARIARSHPQLAGSRRRLAVRARNAPRRHAGTDRTRLMPLGGLASLYMGAAMAYDDGAGVAGAFDVIAGLSLCHGNLEQARMHLWRDGEEGLRGFLRQTQALGWGGSGGAPDPGDPPGPGGGPAGDPWGPGDPIDPEGDPWGPGGIPGGGGPGLPCPPPPDDLDEFVREGCEERLLQVLEEGAPSLGWHGRVTGFADGIDRVELEGPCAGQRLHIHGAGFGDTRPDNRALVLKVDGRCREVEADSWSDSEIVVTLPEGVESGPVGFYDPMGVNAWNRFAGQSNADARAVLTASRCLGAPLLFPEWPVILHTPCPPDTGVNWLEIGDPVIRRFEADSRDDSGEGEVGASVLAEPGDVVVLRWHVERAETLRLRRVSADGPGFGGNPEVVIATGASWTLGPLAHTGPAVFTYELEAVNECATVRRQVSILANKRPGLAITHVEITQGIQSEDNPVVLVAGKRTGFRLFATHALAGFGGFDRLPGVRGRIRVRDQGGSWRPWLDAVNGSGDDTPNPGATIALPAEPARREIDDTLNFVVPFTLCSGTLDVQLQLRVDDALAPPGLRGYSETRTLTLENVRFEERAHSHIRFIPATVVITDATPVVFFLSSNPPTAAECTDLVASAYRRYLPAVPGIIEPHPTLSVTIGADAWTINTPLGTIDLPPGWSASNQFDILGNANLEWLQLIRACQFLDFTGFLCSDGDDAIWALLAPINSWGRALPTSNILLAPMDDESLAHELSHLYGQAHLALTCPDDDSPPAANPLDETTHPDFWTDGGEITDVVWDIDNNRLIFATDDEAGRVFDLMTYCTRRWTHPQRWQRLFDAIGE